MCQYAWLFSFLILLIMKSLSSTVTTDQLGDLNAPLYMIFLFALKLENKEHQAKLTSNYETKIRTIFSVKSFSSTVFEIRISREGIWTLCTHYDLPITSEPQSREEPLLNLRGRGGSGGTRGRVTSISISETVSSASDDSNVHTSCIPSVRTSLLPQGNLSFLSQ